MVPACGGPLPRSTSAEDPGPGDEHATVSTVVTRTDARANGARRQRAEVVMENSFNWWVG
jgi:hypothetical protein